MKKGKRPADEPPKKPPTKRARGKLKERMAVQEEADDADVQEIVPLLPRQDISKHLRKGMRSATILYLSRRPTAEQTARRIADRILNANIRKERDFRTIFERKWHAYKNVLVHIPKKSKAVPVVVEIVHHYSRILSQMVSDIKMDWFEFDAGDPTKITKFAHKLNSGRTGSFWGSFVELTRKSFPTMTTDLIYSPTTGGMRPLADAQDRLKEAWTAADALAGIRRAATGVPTAASPFIADPAYPGFAVFCAFYSSQNLTDNLKAISDLIGGKQLQEMVPLQDRAFLLNVYAHFCCGFDMKAGWYFSDDAASDIAHISQWMAKEDGMEKKQAEAAKAVTGATKDLVAGIEALQGLTGADADYDAEAAENSDN
jgi:hypothetical protein